MPTMMHYRSLLLVALALVLLVAVEARVAEERAPVPESLWHSCYYNDIDHTFSLVKGKHANGTSFLAF